MTNKAKVLVLLSYIIAIGLGVRLGRVTNMPNELILSYLIGNRKDIESWILLHNKYNKLDEVRSGLCEAVIALGPPFSEKSPEYWRAFSEHYFQTGDLPRIFQKYIYLNGISFDALAMQADMINEMQHFKNDPGGAAAANHGAEDKAFISEMAPLIESFDKTYIAGKPEFNNGR